jgi:hypothetical protein
MNTSYRNDPNFKAECIASAEKHVSQDMLKNGTYGKMNGEFHGCSVGCDAFDITGEIQDEPHSITADNFGWPEWLERCRDTFFENLEDGAGWHVRFKEAVPVGITEKQFDIVRSKFILFILEENIERVTGLSINDELKNEVISAIRQCAALHTNIALGS